MLFCPVMHARIQASMIFSCINLDFLSFCVLQCKIYLFKSQMLAGRIQKISLYMKACIWQSSVSKLASPIGKAAQTYRLKLDEEYL